MILRGVCQAISLLPERLDSIKATNANCVRWMIYADPIALNAWSPEEYQGFINNELTKMALITPWFTERCMYMIIDLHADPGGKRLWTEKVWQDQFVATWQKIAQTCISQPNIPYYGLLNEPLPPGNNQAQWLALAARAVTAIHAIEPGKKIIVSSVGGSPALLSLMRPIAGVETYEAHMYDPGYFTYQGLFGNRQGVLYTAKEQQRTRIAMKRIRDWQTRFHKEIFLGEFAAVRWAAGDGMYKFNREVANLANQWGWHWCYLHWEDDGSNMWDLQMSTQYCPDLSCGYPRQETSRSLAMKKAFLGLVI